MSARKSTGATMLHEILQFLQKSGNLVTKTVIPFLYEQWKGVFLGVAGTGTLLSVANNSALSVVFTWLILTIMAIITITNKWKVVLKLLRRKIWLLFSALVNTMIGKKGLKVAIFTNGSVLFVLGFLTGGKNGPYIAAVGVLLIIGFIVYSFDNMAKPK